MLAAALLLPATGHAAPPQTGARPFFDSRAADRRAAPLGRTAASARERSARSALRRRLGPQAVVDADPLTGTVRSVQRLDGALTGPAAGDRRTVARAWIRSHRTALGLTAADVDALPPPQGTVNPVTGVTHLRYRQASRGIPAFDNGLRVNLDRGGRIVNVTGSPVSGLRVRSVEPRLDAVAAMRALQRDVDVVRAVDVTSPPAGVRRETRFAGGDFARLVLFGGAGGARLAWHLTYRASSLALYDAVVDATTGAVLYRQNLTKSAVPATVYEAYPGAGPEVTRDLQPWLNSATQLRGPYVRTFSDLDDDDAQDAGEGVARTGGGDYVYPFESFAGTSCSSGKLCSWDPDVDGSWADNRERNAVQAFYLANVFRAHLAAAPIGFDGFGGDDPVIVHTDDGAETGPDDAHLNNANMSTPPDGFSPTMQMYLFAAPFRNVNGGDDAATVWHEFTHGLSNRLVTNDDGSGALSSPHAGAMGEGWSDWYALDLLDREDLQSTIDIGEYTDPSGTHLTRTEPMDCTVGEAAPRCPGGGYTLGDFGTIAGGPEVHADGEIWGQTLWDLRTALGSDLTERLITEAMRLSPPEPSFLDMRNAILAADTAIAGGAHRSTLWTVFARRGMGFYASALDSADVTPTQSFSGPPAANAPQGRIAGTVTAAESGLPLGGVTVRLAGPAGLIARTAADGTYTLAAPPGVYGDLVFEGAGLSRLTVSAFRVTGGVTRVQNAAMHRNWAAAAGGARVLRDDARYDDTGAPFGCGLAQLIDQASGTGWSPFNPASADPGNPDLGTPTAVVVLPRAIDVTAFGLDPSNTCGDDETATTKDYRVETSADGVHFTLARQGRFTMADRGRLNRVLPAAGARNVRYVRLRLLSPQRALPGDSGADFIDFSELAVYGAPPNRLPSGTLTTSAATTGVRQPVTFTAAFTDADSRIIGYDWDFDGNGTVDRSTAGPVTTFAYGAAGAFGARVLARDFRGGAGAAATTVTVPPGPSLGLPRRGSRGRARLRVTCGLPCSVRARLTLTKRQARALGLRRRGAAKLRREIASAEPRRLTLRLSKRVRRAARRHDVARVAAKVWARAAYDDGRSRAGRRKIRIRLPRG